MSVPHTGKLTGLVNGTDCQFDGNAWSSADSRLAAALNAATTTSPRQHFDVRELAQHVCRKLELQLQVTTWTPDAWTGPDAEEPEGVD